jgi:hypothetical protein
VLALIGLVLALSGLAYGGDLAVSAAQGPPPPNYLLAPSAACLRAHGYTVSRPFDGDFGRETVEIDGRLREVWLVAFTPSAARASRNASTDPYGIPTVRNVVFDIEGVGLGPRDQPIVACLRT